MKLTVVICTWNRCELLRFTLDRLAQIVVPPGIIWELLVVNNNSTDATDEVIASFAGRLPIRGLFEPTAGKSHALNRAVSEAAGDYIVFTDDDVLVHRDWLAAYVSAFRRWPEAVVFGGPIEPWFPTPPPDWLQRTFPQIKYAFGALDLGAEPRPLGGDDVPFGANMAVRGREQRANPYDPSLGPRPGSGLRGEEITLAKRFLAQGATGWWVPDARVQHYVPPERMTIRHVRKWYTGWGEYLSTLPSPLRSRMLAGRPLWLWRQAVESELRYRVRRSLAAPEAWIEDLKLASQSWGTFASYRRHRALREAAAPGAPAAA